LRGTQVAGFRAERGDIKADDAIPMPLKTLILRQKEDLISYAISFSNFLPSYILHHPIIDQGEI